MPKFMIERRFRVAEKDMPEVNRRSRRLMIDRYPEITWEHSHVVITDDGAVKTYCVYAAPSEELVRKHAEELGAHDVEAVYEVAGDVTPDDFPLD
jgi:predicted phosphoribosyltransferase